MTNDAIIKALSQDNLLSAKQLEALQRRIQRTGQGIWQALIELKYCDDAQLYPVMSQCTGIPLGDTGAASLPPPSEAARLLPARIAWQFRCALLRVEGGTAEIAFVLPPDGARLEQLALLTGYRIRAVLAPGAQVERCLEKTYGLGADNMAHVPGRAPAAGAAAEDAPGEASNQATSMAARLVDQFIEEACRAGATDIHFEPYRRRLQVRFRVDGRLRDVPMPEGIDAMAETILSRIKVMAQMDITEKRLPQDGRLRFRRANGTFCDLRVSTLPTRFGENICLRLLNLERLCLPMDELGLDERQLRQLRQLLSVPNGLILVTGPTGSGKTTTLYSILTHLHDKLADAKIVTVEDPVEYEMPGITQVQTHAGIGLTFSAALRAILRHDPDIILVGEIRDEETALIAVQAALTGHLVFATLHTNDSVGAVSRLMNMGIAPDLVAGSLRGVVAQRLVRRVCPHCAVPDTALDAGVAEELAAVVRRNGLLMPTPMAAAPEGCPACGGTGYAGRVAIYEMLLNFPEMETLIERGAPASALRAAALRNGLQTLREDGWNKVARGITSVAEVLRVAPTPLSMTDSADK